MYPLNVTILHVTIVVERKIEDLWVQETAKGACGCACESVEPAGRQLGLHRYLAPWQHFHCGWVEPVGCARGAVCKQRRSQTLLERKLEFSDPDLG